MNVKLFAVALISLALGISNFCYAEGAEMDELESANSQYGETVEPQKEEEEEEEEEEEKKRRLTQQQELTIKQLLLMEKFKLRQPASFSEAGRRTSVSFTRSPNGVITYTNPTLGTYRIHPNGAKYKLK